LISNFENHFGAIAYRKWNNGRLLGATAQLSIIKGNADGVVIPRWDDPLIGEAGIEVKADKSDPSVIV
jgi:hypothetical protein